MGLGGAAAPTIKELNDGNTHGLLTVKTPTRAGLLCSALSSSRRPQEPHFTEKKPRLPKVKVSQI